MRPGSLMAVTLADSASNHIDLNLKGAEPMVSVEGGLGIVAKVHLDGVRARPVRGGWQIPLRTGGEGRLAIKGFLPGFQTFLWQGEPVLKLGAHVARPERIVMYAPVLLFIAWWFMAPVALLLFFMNIPIVKNPLMPRIVRFVLPLVNTIAGAIALFAVAALASSK